MIDIADTFSDVPHSSKPRWQVDKVVEDDPFEPVTNPSNRQEVQRCVFPLGMSYSGIDARGTPTLRCLVGAYSLRSLSRPG